MSNVVKAFKALSDGTRLRILNILLERECCVCEVMDVLGISQPSASRHLGVLHDAGFLKARKEGIWMLYDMDWQGMPDYAREMVEASRLGLKDNQEALEDKKRLAGARRMMMESCARG
jgi:ArsR family transcriptional regulator